MQPKLSFESFLRPVGIREAARFSSSLNPTAQNVVLIFFLGFAALFLFAGFVILLAGGLASLPFALVIGVVPMIMITGVLYGLFKNGIRALKLKRFSEANGFAFTLNRPTQDYPGLVFAIGHSPQYVTVVNGTYKGLPFEFGNFFCTEGSGKNAKQRAFGIIEVKLHRRLPHMLLDSTANNSLGFSNLPRFYDSQQLSLEGNFNDYFNLYVPDGYERDALYVITPELMVLLIDLGANFDIEIVDDRLYIYSSKSFAFQNQQTIEQIFKLIEILGAEVVENTDRYADATIGNRQANMVAKPGRRLRRYPAWLVVLFWVLWGIFIFFIATKYV